MFRANYGLIIRRNNCVFVTLSTCYSVWTTVWYAGWNDSWNMMAHGDAWKGKWRGNWRMECVASTLSTLHTTSERGVSSITTADAHTSSASSQLNWRTHRFKWTRPFCRKMKSGFCACAITFQTQSTKCRINTVVSPDDGLVVARNM
jgi:hypothetical protein